MKYKKITVNYAICKKLKELAQEGGFLLYAYTDKIISDYLFDKQKYKQEHKEEFRKLYRQKNKEKIREQMLGYAQTEKGKRIIKKSKAKAHAKRRRNFGFNPLNEAFENSVGHHVNNNDVVFIPEKVHLSYYAGSDAEKHRRLVLEHYGTLENMINNQRGESENKN